MIRDTEGVLNKWRLLVAGVGFLITIILSIFGFFGSWAFGELEKIPTDYICKKDAQRTEDRLIKNMEKITNEVKETHNKIDKTQMLIIELIQKDKP